MKRAQRINLKMSFPKFINDSQVFEKTNLLKQAKLYKTCDRHIETLRKITLTKSDFFKHCNYIFLFGIVVLFCLDRYNL